MLTIRAAQAAHRPYLPFLKNETWLEPRCLDLLLISGNDQACTPTSRAAPPATPALQTAHSRS